MNSEEERTSMLPALFAEIDWEEYETLAGIGYTPEKIAMYFRIDVSVFLSHYLEEGSELKLRYDTGMLQAQAKEGIIALNSAIGGNATQALRLDKIRKNIAFEEHKKRIIYGE